MGFLDGLIKRLGYVPQDPYTLIPRTPAKAAPLTEAPAFLRADAIAEQYSIPDRSLPEAQLELYQRLSWVQIAVSKVAEVGATTAFNVMALAGEETNDIPNHPFELLLRRPNPLHSRAEFLEGTLAYYALTGNAYWWLNKVGNTVAELWLLPPHKVKPVPDGRMFLRGYIYQADEMTSIPLELTEVVHFRRFHPLNSFVGLSPIEALAVVATGDMAAQKWNTNFFDKNNAKMPGVLAFRDPIPDPDWDRMRRDVKEEYGGTKRSLMMMRGVGDGVQWISTAMSQGDMQFLEGRTFTKEEIFAIYAPGLSSMLAVNATEANSVSGKRTFIEYGVWPHLVRIAEKITNDLLPLYGPNLVGEFDDIRVTDKQMELSEISAYSQTHTVDEVRAKYYQDEPLGDDRGNLLVTEVGKGLTPADPEAQELAKEAQRKALENPQPTAVQDSEDAADQNESGDDSEDMQGDMQHGDMGQMQAEGRQGETGRQQEVKALRRWLRNRGDKADPLKFRRVHLSEADVLDIADQLRSDGEADTVQPPFTWTDGSLTHEWAAVKAMVLQLDPGEDDAAERVITELERRGETTILRAFREQWQNLLPPNAENMELGELMAYINSRLISQQPTVDAIARVLYDAAGAGVNIALDQLERIGIGFDYALVNTRAQDWAKRYSGELIAGINDTTKQAVQQAVERWYGNGEPLSALIDDLQPAFSKKRAKLIASTETTRASAEGTRAGFRESGVVTGMVWKTGRDELVCQICGALDGKIVSLDGGRFYDELPAEIQQRMKRTFEIPPAHPACRCRLAARVLGADARPQAQVQPVALSPEVVAANRYVPFDNYRDANDWAEKAYAEFDKSLTKKDNKVIDTYCGAGSHYREWNTALRSGTPLRSELQSATKSLDEIISRATPGRDIVTYRGTRNVFPHDYGELQKLVGTTITDKGYVSTSFNQFRAFDFGGAQDAIMEIRIPKTAKAAYLNPSESEIVLPRNTQFKVVETRIDQEDPEEPSWMVVVLEVLE